MRLSHKTVRAILSRWSEEGIVTDYCSKYGEPGYDLDTDAETPLVVLGDYWCRCDRFGTDDNGRAELHGREKHHPRLWARLEEQGVQFEWYDEWIVEHETGKAYRTTGDCYAWMPSYTIDDGGEILTPDSDLNAWLEWAANDAARCLLSRVWSSADLIRAGFERYNGQYESGWHPGQDDDPQAITATIHAERGDDVDIVFLLDSTGQFDVAFSAYYRGAELDDACPHDPDGLHFAGCGCDYFSPDDPGSHHR